MLSSVNENLSKRLAATTDHRTMKQAHTTELSLFFNLNNLVYDNRKGHLQLFLTFSLY